MTDEAILLKVLLRQRHLQGHRAFCKEYDKVAAKIDPELRGGHPSKAQFYRWLSGDLVGLPYADHCRILESMFPEWSAEQLFKPYNNRLDFVPESGTSPQVRPQRAESVASAETGKVADIVAAYASRSDFMHDMPPRQLFDDANKLRLVGLSLNILCQHYPDRALKKLLESGCTVDCLFLDPDGEYIARRECEESQTDGHLSTLTKLNIDALRRIRAKLSPEAAENLRIRTYDEPVRFNITVVDDSKCVVQPYLPDARGVESPTLVLERSGDTGLFDTFAQVFNSMWNRAKEVSP
ncbi:hypothetical protein EV193_102405 [Herbihabitans rhizosphaerae]|uniref:DUF5919 domain-containing protein n=1 Tax=Herbihabitans rhizosphaerae TaxID=1872711 RepID=A0A4Q7L2S8_9PSEU|nr:DUF5919 domain-containing protein [Herbihabitans rhizosphaerae]RZS43426.1 hypothetical protein EV193_102405 [Herbihabitans rhizosphaerae]